MARSSHPRDRFVTSTVTLCDSKSSVVITTMDAEQATTSRPVHQTTARNVRKEKQQQGTRQSDENPNLKAPQDANGSNQSQKRPQQQSSKQRGLPRDSPQVRLSKTVSWLLRHGAASEGLSMRPDGYVKVTDLVCTPEIKGIRWLRWSDS